MKLGPITGNDVQMLPKKHERNQPDGGAVIAHLHDVKNSNMMICL